VALVLEWRAAWGKGFGWFLWTASLTLVINQWIGIKTDPGNFVILVPALVLVFGAWVERWGKVGEWATGLSLLFLGIGLWALFLATLKYGDQPQQSPLLFFPLPLFVLGALYSIRSQLASNRRSPCEPLPNGPAG
jgi:hypothetical protein